MIAARKPLPQNTLNDSKGFNDLTNFLIPQSTNSRLNDFNDFNDLPFTAYRLPLTVYRSPFTAYRLPLTVYFLIPLDMGSRVIIY